MQLDSPVLSNFGRPIPDLSDLFNLGPTRTAWDFNSDQPFESEYGDVVLLAEVDRSCGGRG
jgi:hypothetical protein